MQIFVKLLSGKTAQLEVLPDEKIQDVKQKIRDKFATAIDEQRLVYSGNTLDDEKTLTDYGIGKEATIYLINSLGSSGAKATSGKMQIQVKTTGKDSVILTVDPNDKPTAVKQMVAEKSGLPAASQSLFHGGKKLDDAKSLKDQGVTPGAPLSVIIQQKGGKF